MEATGTGGKKKLASTGKHPTCFKIHECVRSRDRNSFFGISLHRDGSGTFCGRLSYLLLRCELKMVIYDSFSKQTYIMLYLFLSFIYIYIFIFLYKFIYLALSLFIAFNDMKFLFVDLQSV